MYKKMYYKLFNAVTDALEDMAQCNYGQARDRLMQAQADCEEIYMDADDEDEEDEPLRFKAEVHPYSIRQDA